MSKIGLLSRKQDKLNFQERLFRTISIIGILALCGLLVISIVIEESVIEQTAISVGVVCVTLITFVACKKHAVHIGALLISVLFSGFLLPVIFIYGGGLYGGASIWFILGFLYINMLLTGIVRIIVLVYAGVVTVICYYVAYSNPRIIVQHTVSAAYIDSVVAVLVFGGVLSVLIVFQNKLYKSENELVRKKNAEIEELNRAQNRFFSSMSHEIRTPINTIIGLNEIILRSEVSDEIAENAVNIQGASNLLLTLINDILDMSKIESGKMQIIPVEYEVNNLISDIVNMIWVRAKSKNLEFKVEADPLFPKTLSGDEIRIKQILINILNNAVKYTDAGSIVMSVHGEMLSEDRIDMIISVKDSGIGIKKESIPYLFDAFHRVDEKNNRRIEGTGLGLSIVKQLVELMGGNITVNSIYTKGSTFTVTIPQKIVGNEMLGEFNLDTKRVLESGHNYKQSFEAPEARILIVDDNEMNLNVATKLLNSTKIIIDVAKSGEECLALTQNICYNGILMDHVMPVMDGIETLKRIRSQEGGMCRNTPVIALTANAGNDSAMFYRNKGFDGYIAKPVNGVLLEAAVLKIIPDELVIEKNVQEDSPVNDNTIFVESGVKRVPIKITTDSVSDLPESLIRAFNIAVIPYYVYTPEGHYLDGVEIAPDALLEYLNDYGESKDIHSEEPTVEDYEEFFAEQLMEADNIIHIVMARHSSKGYFNAVEAAGRFGNVEVIDSGHLSSGLGIVVLEAAKMVYRGMDTDSVIEKISEVSKLVSTSFVVRSTSTLRNVGRISPVIHRLCRTIMINPVISLVNSRMTVRKVFFGNRKNVKNKYIRSLLRHAENIDNELLFITYVGLDRQEVDNIKRQVLDIVPFENVYIQKASAVISSNCGPETFGLIYKRKDKNGEKL